MTSIKFYFDPSCPWCWITSRWLTEVQKHRDVYVEWLPFSLAMKNGELDGTDVTGHLDTHTIAHKVLRIIEAVHEQEQVDRGVLYTEFGKSYFIDPELQDDDFMSAVLERMGLRQDYLLEAENQDRDVQLKAHLDAAVDIAGNDVGVPLIVFETSEGPRGYFGPVITKLPELKEGLELWDGLQKMASNPTFFELKRSRTERSKVKSTKRLFTDIS